MKVLEQNIIKTKIMDWNAAYYGVSIYEWMDRAGKGITSAITKKFQAKRKKLRIAFFCGTGNNGGDGFVAAKYLHPNHDVVVYLFGREKDIKTPESRKAWKEMVNKQVSHKLVSSKQGVGGIEGEFDVIVDCLLGTGVSGKLREPIASAVNLFNKIDAKKVAVDFPTKGIKGVDLVISMQFPKVKGAEVVDLQSDPKFLEKIGPGEFKALEFPGADSHKGEAGKLLIIAGSEQYHGSLLYAVKAAAKVVDLIYVLTTEENQKLIKKLKSKTAEFIPVDSVRKNVDCVLVGPGLGQNRKALELTKQVIKSKKKAVLDADALLSGIKDLLHKQVILTPHKKEFERVFGIKADRQSVEKMMKKYNCTIVLKGRADVVASLDWGLKRNLTGNEGMTKGGTGDVLAGLISAFYCLTDEPYLAAASGVFVNGLAGDALYEKVNRFYDAEDLLEQLPKTMSNFIS